MDAGSDCLPYSISSDGKLTGAAFVESGDWELVYEGHTTKYGSVMVVVSSSGEIYWLDTNTGLIEPQETAATAGEKFFTLFDDSLARGEIDLNLGYFGFGDDGKLLSSDGNVENGRSWSNTSLDREAVFSSLNDNLKVIKETQVDDPEHYYAFYRQASELVLVYDARQEDGASTFTESLQLWSPNEALIQRLHQKFASKR